MKFKDKLVILSKNMDDWPKNWVGLLFVNPGNEDGKRKEHKKN
jgi:hypothetical protein